MDKVEEKPACGFCKFWSVNTDLRSGACRRFPPHFIVHVENRNMAQFIFPITAADSWCGEFARKEEE